MNNLIEKCTSQWKGKLNIVQGLFLILTLTTSSSVVGQHATPFEAMSENTRRIRIMSPNKKAGADIFLDKKLIKVHREVWRKGNIGRVEPFWSMEGDFRQGWITDDGEYFVGCPGDLNLLPLNFSKDLTILSFFKHGSLIAGVRLDQLITDFSRLEKSESGYRWSKYIGLNECGSIALETIESRKILIDVTNGIPEEFKPAGPIRGPQWKRYEDIMRCYQFQYPDTYSLKASVVERGDRKGFPIGNVFLKGDGKWTINGIYENVRDFDTFSKRPFEDFAVERGGLMYSADGCQRSIYAKGTALKESFTNPNGLSVLELYFTVVQEGYGEETENIEGPVYAVRLSSHAGSYPYAVLFLYLHVIQLIEGEGKDLARQKDTLRKIVDSVRILKMERFQVLSSR